MVHIKSRMKTAGKREVRENFSAFLDDAQTETILVLDRGKPYAVIQGVEGRKLEDVVADEQKPKPSRKKK